MNKKILFLIIITILLIYPKMSLAEDQFYEAEYIPNIFMNKYEYATGITYFQQARFFRNQSTSQEAYCLEPFRMFNGNSYYESTNNPRSLSEDQIKRLKKIAYFGYKYKNHTDVSWYAITQLMIWKESFPNSGDYYFTNILNGNRINIYENEIEEINTLVNNYNSQLPINNNTYTVVENKEHIIELDNNLEDYYSDNNEITINTNSITINPLEEGIYSVTINKNIARDYTPSIIYQSSNSQNMILRGDLEIDPTTINIKVIKTSLTIIKKDVDNNTYNDASLDGTIFNIYNENDELIQEIEINNGKASINNLDFGNYYIKETKPGIGYQINNEKYEFTINEDNPNIELTINNKVIEKKIKIIKKYGEENNYLPEPNISFNIYDSNNNLITTITTNNNGEAETILPFGTYIMVQSNTTEGYATNDPIKIVVNNTDEEVIELIDYKIRVPNTSKNINILLIIIKLLFIC